MASDRGWATKLAHPIVLRDRTTLETLHDAAAFLLGQPSHLQQRTSWRRLIDLIIRAAETGHAVEETTAELEDLLFLQVRRSG
jgi:hypothetical protein